MILAVKWLMTFATVLFVAGYSVASKNVQLHRRLMISGLVSFLGIAALLVLGAQVYGATYEPAAWAVRLFGGKGSADLLIAHRVVATVSALLLLTQAWSGWKRRSIHPRMARLTLMLWLVSYVSGSLLFV
jgi:uncharacterized membrane protein YozB (DUF420 family)